MSTSIILCACRLEHYYGSGDGGDTTPIATIRVIGYHGASILRPRHMLASYQKTTDDGADIIESDLVSTKGSVLVARHENEISDMTDVADVATFAERKTTKTIDDRSVAGWLTEGSTPGELETLHTRERIPNVRPDNIVYNDQFDIPTLDGIIVLTRDRSARFGRNISIYPETKHPTYSQSVGLPLKDRLIDGLCRGVFTTSRTTVYIQPFGVANLKAVRNKIGDSQPNRRLVQLMDMSDRQPYDFVVARDSHTLGGMMTSRGIRDIAAYANGVDPDESSIMSLDANGELTDPTDLIRDVHNARLAVHPYTFRPENTLLSLSLRSGTDNTCNVNDSITEIQMFPRAGVDGFLADDPAVG